MAAWNAVTMGGEISINLARVKEISPPARPFGADRGDFFARGTKHLGSTAPVHLGFTPFADFAAEGVRVASV